MKIAKNSAVTLRQRVSDIHGQVIDEGAEPVRYIHGGYHDIFDKIEQALDGKRVGDVITVRLEPKDSFEEHDPGLVIVAAMDQFATPPALGDLVERDQGRGTQLYRVAEIREDGVVLDGNHPFAGLTLDFQAEVLEVRPASVEEVVRVERAVTASISRWRALKMAASKLVAAPVILFLVAGVLAEWLGPGITLTLVLLFLFAVLLYCLWTGGRYVRDMVRGGEVLRLDVKGLFWRDFGTPVAWEDIAKVEFGSNAGNEAWYSVTLADERQFKVNASALSISTTQISWLFANYLPAAKLEGI
jgi:FKBP-type peptidyl-prolyl cis-trans isomerase 2